MKINSINHNNPYFKARWSSLTLQNAQTFDKHSGTQLEKQLQEALDKNPELKNYGGDDVILSLGSRSEYNRGSYRQYYTVCIEQEFNGYKVKATLQPKSYAFCPAYEISRHQLSQSTVLQGMKTDEYIKMQILNTVSTAKTFKADLLNGLSDFFASCCIHMENNEKCKVFDSFFGQNKE